MTTFEQNIREQVVGIGKSNIPSDEKEVLRLLFVRWKDKEGKITQKEIAEALPNLGRHTRDRARTEETTLRMVRQVIRYLRVNRWAPIISDADGYWIPRNEEEAREYMSRMEAEVRARAAASFETYRAMRESLGIANAFFDGQEKLLDLPIAGEAESASTPGKKYNLYHVAGKGWICECPSFRYRERCRHAAEAAAVVSSTRP